MERLNIKCIIPGEQTDGRVSVFEEVIGPKAGPPLHLHKHQLEIFHVLKGRIRFQIEDQSIEVEAGGTAVVPPGLPHGFQNLCDHESIIHFELLPSGNSERFFEKLTSGECDDLQQFFEEHDLELLGPPMGSAPM